jgi:hypothetical protein
MRRSQYLWGHQRILLYWRKLEKVVSSSPSLSAITSISQITNPDNFRIRRPERFGPLARQRRWDQRRSPVNHRGKTPKRTQASVITTDAASKNGVVNFWCSPSSRSDNPTSRKVDGVSGLTGKPVVICPNNAA